MLANKHNIQQCKSCLPFLSCTSLPPPPSSCLSLPPPLPPCSSPSLPPSPPLLPVLQSASLHLSFAPQLHAAARAAIRQLFGALPFLAVQWRTEYAVLQPEMGAAKMLACARELVHTAKDLIQVGATLGVVQRLFSLVEASLFRPSEQPCPNAPFNTHSVCHTHIPAHVALPRARSTCACVRVQHGMLRCREASCRHSLF